MRLIPLWMLAFEQPRLAAISTGNWATAAARTVK